MTTLNEQQNKVKELVEKLNRDFGLRWRKFKQHVDSAIDELHIQTINKLKHHSQWRKIFNNEGGQYDINWWVDMERIIDHIKSKLSSSIESREKIDSLKARINTKFSEHKAKVKYGVFPCQDTILPLFFKQSYNRHLEVEFKEFKSWSDGLNAFRNSTIDVALHNFPTTIAFNTFVKSKHPLFFFPFFSFNGYGIFIKINAIKDIAKKYKVEGNKFDNLSTEVKKELFETSKILIERETDFEWALIKYSESFGCDVKKLQKNMINCNTNLAKSKFITENKYIIYCTNPIHIFDLKRNAKKYEIELIGHGQEILDHQNFNGLICTHEFLNKNVDVVAELIATWFNDIIELQKEIKKARINPLKNIDLLLPMLQRFLNEYTVSTIELDDLLNVFEGHNTFYDNPKEAFDTFYGSVLQNDSAIFNNYIKIAQIQLGDFNTNNDLESVMNSIKKQMNELYL